MTEIGPDEEALAEWSLRGSGVPSIEVVECLARRHMAARRSGGRVVLSNVCPDLAGLLELTGLAALSDS